MPDSRLLHSSEYLCAALPRRHCLVCDRTRAGCNVRTRLRADCVDYSTASPHFTTVTNMYEVVLKIPEGIQCENCVLQWM
jgi:hypothetical protein